MIVFAEVSLVTFGLIFCGHARPLLGADSHYITALEPTSTVMQMPHALFQMARGEVGL